MSTGDRVRVELEPELFQAMQEGRGVWNDLMLNVSTEEVEKLFKKLHHPFVLAKNVLPFVPMFTFPRNAIHHSRYTYSTCTHCM